MPEGPKRGDRLTDKSAQPDETTIRDWMGQEAFGHWQALSRWIAAAYPGVFAPDWIFGGQKHGWSLRYKKSRAFCTLLPEYGAFSVVVVLGRAEREKVEGRRDAWAPRLMALYDAAETFHDGKWLKIGVNSAEEVKEVTDLLSLKRPRRAG